MPMCLVCNSVDNTFVLTLIQHANEQLCHARQTYLGWHPWIIVPNWAIYLAGCPCIVVPCKTNSPWTTPMNGFVKLGNVSSW
jgi:hypothetical protein